MKINVAKILALCSVFSPVFVRCTEDPKRPWSVTRRYFLSKKSDESLQLQIKQDALTALEKKAQGLPGPQLEPLKKNRSKKAAMFILATQEKNRITRVREGKLEHDPVDEAFWNTYDHYMRSEV